MKDIPEDALFGKRGAVGERQAAAGGVQVAPGFPGVSGKGVIVVFGAAENAVSAGAVGAGGADADLLLPVDVKNLWKDAAECLERLGEALKDLEWQVAPGIRELQADAGEGVDGRAAAAVDAPCRLDVEAEGNRAFRFRFEVGKCAFEELAEDLGIGPRTVGCAPADLG